MSDDARHLYERLLVLRCQAGDELALRELIVRYSPGLRLYLLKLCGDAAAVDDLLQETWFDAYRKVNALRNPAAFAEWLYRIARDKAYRHLRRRRRAPLPFDDQPESALAVEEDDDRLTAEDAGILRAALDRIPFEQREVLLLRYAEDMSYEQIAAVVGRPVGTVRSRLHHAKLAVRGQMTPPSRKEGKP